MTAENTNHATRSSSATKAAKRVVVLGGGPGGYAAAFLAADLGFAVTLVENEPRPGGVCLHRGCIPSKTLLHVARLLTEAKQARSWGINFVAPSIDLTQLAAHCRQVTDKLAGGLVTLARQRKVTIIEGTGKFLDPATLQVKKADGSTLKVAFDDCIIATGSRPVRMDGIPYDNGRVMTSDQALQIKDVPASLLVIGGGFIGMELATVYAALGSQVTIVEALPTVLTGADADLLQPLTRHLTQSLGMEILVNTRMTAMSEADGKLAVSFPDDCTRRRSFDKALVSVGRRPNCENLGLESTAVKLTERGFIVVDQQRRTHEPNIFAIGDISGDPMLAHKATAEARVAVDAIADRPSSFDVQAIPTVVFTDPEVAWAGITETQARSRNLPHTVLRFPWAASGRAATLGRTEGLTKFILDARNQRVLGVGIVGVGAGELIAEGVLAVEMAAQARDVLASIHPHPTLSETLMEAAEQINGGSPHYINRERIRGSDAGLASSRPATTSVTAPADADVAALGSAS